MFQIAVRGLALGLALSLSTPAWSADPSAGRKLYRYTNAKGVMVLDFQLPPDQVYRGYTVLSTSGTVLEVVPPSMSPQEREALRQREPERLKAEQEKLQQDENDRRLLAIYASPADVGRARDRKLEALDLQMSVDRGNVARLQTDLDATQVQAANRERSGQGVPAELVEKIDSLARQITTLGEGIKKREAEKESIRKASEQDLARLQYLLANPQRIRALQAASGQSPR